MSICHQTDTGDTSLSQTASQTIHTCISTYPTRRVAITTIPCRSNYTRADHFCRGDIYHDWLSLDWKFHVVSPNFSGLICGFDELDRCKKHLAKAAIALTLRFYISRFLNCAVLFMGMVLYNRFHGSTNNNNYLSRYHTLHDNHRDSDPSLQRSETMMWSTNTDFR
jgi:hypothetical protein